MILKFSAGLLALLVLGVALFIAYFDWNLLRGPVERMVTEKTGRSLVIHGDLILRWGWPSVHLEAGGVTFANPDWAIQRQMLAIEGVDIELNLGKLLHGRIELPVVRLVRGVVFLEKDAGGRSNWLLDRNQQEESERVSVGLLEIVQGHLSYEDHALKTHLQATIATDAAEKAGPGLSVLFDVSGRYKGSPLDARGAGGAVLSLGDASRAYPIKIDLRTGRTALQASGTITGLARMSALDMRVTLSGDSLARLFPLIGIALPETNPYATSGRLLHERNTWRYEAFSGKIGSSDVAGTLQVNTGGARPYLHGRMDSQLLDFTDLGPLIGARPGALRGSASAVDDAPDGRAALRSSSAGAAGAHVLPQAPFRADRWDSVDADVTLNAIAIRRDKALPIDNLSTRIVMKDSVLKLSPLRFGVAGGELAGPVVLDGNHSPIWAEARLDAKRLKLSELVPGVALARTSAGRLDGYFRLAGTGNSVAAMLGNANGDVGLVVAGGEVSNLLVEIAGLDVWEAIRFKLGGDKTIRIRCGVAGFGVNNGLMSAHVLDIDTEDTNIQGSGDIDLKGEKLDLLFNPQPKDKSPLVFRSPIRVKGNLVRPEVQLDRGRIALRGLGALALGVVNPLLALLPLIETGPGLDSDCKGMIRSLQHTARQARSAPAVPGR